MEKKFLLFTLCTSLLFCSAFLSSCKPSKTDSFFELKYAKSACKGRCPVFDIKVTDDQMVTFNGRKYTTIVGLVQMRLPDDAYKELQKLIKESNFLETDVISYNRAFDIPVTTLEVSKGDKSKKQIMYMDKPKDLEPVLKFLDMLVIEVQSESKTN